MYVIKNDDMKVPLKIWSKEGTVEQQCIDQMMEVCKLPFLFHHVALMPDAHLGVGTSIGSVVGTNNVILPYLVGVDQGCGMCAVRTNINLTELDTDTLKSIMGKIREQIPVGFNHHKSNREWSGFDEAPAIPIIQQELNSARKQLGTLGGGK